jgi:hypothetical protein
MTITMKAMTIRHVIKVRLFAVVLLATCAFAAAANADTFLGRFTLPFEVHWGKSVLPAGNYTISMDSSTDVALVRSANGKAMGYTPIPIKTSSGKGATALFVVVHGNERMVRSLNLPASGVSLIYQPATSSERETLANADQVQAVPIITAGK